MKTRGLSQEGLKVIACVTMLLDHIGATMVPGWTLRIIGRVAFPIYCFLIAEGAHYTKNKKKYALRLAAGALLSEIPFDLALFGGLTWQHQSVMVTMLLGFCALWAMEREGNMLLKGIAAAPFAVAAELLMTDYGGAGVAIIVLFSLTREVRNRWLVQLLGLAMICGCWIPGAIIEIRGLTVAIELFALAALVPIGLYSGEKRTKSPVVQWGFYLFYPVHLWVIWFTWMRLVGRF